MVFMYLLKDYLIYGLAEKATISSDIHMSFDI